MEQEIHAYWRERLEEACAVRDDHLNQMRAELSRLQDRCQDLSTVNAMGRASVAHDIYTFALGATQESPHGVRMVPLEELVDYLHHYSNGLIPQLERQGKRGRDERLGHNMRTVPLNRNLGPRPLIPAAQQSCLVPAKAKHHPQLQHQHHPVASMAVVEAPQQQHHQEAPESTEAPEQQYYTAEAVVDEDDASAAPQPAAAASSSSSSFPATCAQQHLRREKRERTGPMDDEIYQIRPWLFSRVP